MTVDQIINRISLALGVLAIVAIILTGFVGQIVTSIVIGVCAILLWLSWITYKLARLLNEALTQKGPIAVVEETATVIYQAHYQELSSTVHHISTRIGKLKFPAEFFQWSQFTIVFWARITQEFVNNKYNKYLFSYTSNPASESKHPNSFYLGVKGGQAYLRFIVSACPHTSPWGSIRRQDTQTRSLAENQGLFYVTPYTLNP